MPATHAPRYDENGNPMMREDTASGAYRQMVWDEENRTDAVFITNKAARPKG
jgi:hypothetical protein